MDYVTTAQIQQPIQGSCTVGLGMDAVNLSGDRLWHSLPADAQAPRALTTLRPVLKVRSETSRVPENNHLPLRGFMPPL